ncbi:hypothetical protein GCM10007852_37860 [Agaribacter marinus]|uniref:Uncharacterized protein n=2 Tax=Agaribacter marinus TaxID=1431249 RepID=A0AA37T5Y5_9ALTE|nr:hypothetical protein GCM10007852_37860 [Agaribacter marinus]
MPLIVCDENIHHLLLGAKSIDIPVIIILILAAISKYLNGFTTAELSRWIELSFNRAKSLYYGNQILLSVVHNEVGKDGAYGRFLDNKNISEFAKYLINRLD